MRKIFGLFCLVLLLFAAAPLGPESDVSHVQILQTPGESIEAVQVDGGIVLNEAALQADTQPVQSDGMAVSYAFDTYFKGEETTYQVYLARATTRLPDEVVRPPGNVMLSNKAPVYQRL